MKIWIDADGCPAEIKEIVYRAAERVKTPTILVANRPLRIPRSAYLSQVQVAAGFDVADGHIVRSALPGDLAVTADIPLAALLVKGGVLVIDPRGELYSDANIAERLTMRNLMQELRGAGMVLGGPRPFDRRDRQHFAATFDRELAKALASRPASGAALESSDTPGPVRDAPDS